MVEDGKYSFQYHGNDLDIWKEYVEDDLSIIFTRLNIEVIKRIESLEKSVDWLKEKV